MCLYNELPVEFLIRFYNELLKNIEKGILSKNMYYELGMIISVASQRGIILETPSDFNIIVNQETLKSLQAADQAHRPYIA